MSEPIGLTHEERAQLLAQTVRKEMEITLCTYALPTRLVAHVLDLATMTEVLARRLSYEVAD